jgi:hypothetical protein
MLAHWTLLKNSFNEGLVDVGITSIFLAGQLRQDRKSVFSVDYCSAREEVKDDLDVKDGSPLERLEPKTRRKQQQNLNDRDQKSRVTMIVLV